MCVCVTQRNGLNILKACRSRINILSTFNHLDVLSHTKDDIVDVYKLQLVRTNMVYVKWIFVKVFHVFVTKKSDQQVTAQRGSVRPLSKRLSTSSKRREEAKKNVPIKGELCNTIVLRWDPDCLVTVRYSMELLFVSTNSQ